ncbi:MAG: radical SAM family heme chaperone HemW [Proteobacteria bacterium]|nr:radical SAM family heme chaperone HemW [Pseudomonadota bacterium]MBU1570843.1 radical SAM family heme chaperone HemW [Pseudomonadota bacterium]
MISNQLPDIRNQKPETSPAGIYIHIPFCVRKCHYCDFYSITDHSLVKEFVDALILEMEMYSEIGLLFDTLYIGGGTPSVLESAEIDRIIKNAFSLFQITSDSEITIEVNPGTVTPESLKSFRQSGINRINIGIQSFQDDNLKFLGRIHSAEEGKTAIKCARNAGFENIGLDLISGISGQTVKFWISDLETAIQFEPEHLSCYMLTYEHGTPLYKDFENGEFSPLPESLAASMFGSTGDFLEKNGYIHYEISNFARSEEKKSRHNTKYWNFAPYIGLGPSAHSFYETRRSWNRRDVSDYIKKIRTGTPSVEGSETLAREQQIIEALFLGLRQKRGIDIGLFNEKFNVRFENVFSETISDLSGKELIVICDDKCALTRKGMVLLDSICAEFVCKELDIEKA